MRDDDPDRLGPRDDPVVVVVGGGIVFIKVVAELGRITLKQEILDVKIGDRHLLMPVVEGVQPAVGVLLQMIEVCEVVLVFVGFQVAENPESGLFFRIDKAAKIALELLNTRAYRDEIVVRA